MWHTYQYRRILESVCDHFRRVEDSGVRAEAEDMESALIVVCHNEASLSFRIGPQSKLADVKSSICSQWLQFSPLSFQLVYNSGEQQKVIETDLDLHSLSAYAFIHKLPSLDFHICYSGESSRLAVVSLEQREVSCATDYDDPNKVKEPLKSFQWLGLFKGVSQLFLGGVLQIRLDVMKYQAASGRRYDIIRNDRLRFMACCAKKEEEKCEWFIYAVYVDGNVGSQFYIKELNNVHTCGGGVIDLSHPHVSKKLISSLIAVEIKDNPNKRTKDIRKQFLREYGFEINRYFAYAGKKHALNTAWGENEDFFKYLKWYTQKLVKTNPESHMVLEVELGTNKFKRMFISFAACILGFNYCRPLIFMDATHLKSKYLGHLMAATGLDGDNEIYPLAYGVVSSENDANWKWFMEHLKQVLNTERQYTFVSDRGSGLVSQIPIVFEGAFHGWCFWHMKNNINACLLKASKTYNKYILDRFSNCAYANTHKVFSENMLKLRQIKNQKLQEYLDRAPADKWASVYFPGCRYGELCSNVAESFNCWVREEREMPIALMVDELRKKVMKQMCVRREECATLFNWRDTLCPKMEIELYNNKLHGREYQIIKSSEFVYEVLSSLTQVVDLKQNTCSCNRWRINGFPCAHVVRCITSRAENPYDYIQPYFRIQLYRQSYAVAVNHVPTVENPSNVSPNSVVFGPNVMIQPGRPKKKKRIPNIGSIPNKKARRCGTCK